MTHITDDSPPLLDRQRSENELRLIEAFIALHRLWRALKDDGLAVEIDPDKLLELRTKLTKCLELVPKARELKTASNALNDNKRLAKFGL